MTAAHASPAVVRAAAIAAGVVGLLVLTVILTSGGSGRRVPGMPTAVAAALGGDPLTVTLHGDVLALVSAPDVQRLAALEARIQRQPYVRRAYGPVSWLDARFAAIARSVAAHTTSRETRAALLVRAGATGGLDISDQELSSTLIFGTGVSPIAPVRWLVPTADQLRIFVVTRGSLSRHAVVQALTRLVSQSGLDAVQSVSATS